MRNPRKTLVDIFHNEITAWVVLSVSLILTGLGWYIAHAYVQHRAEDRFLFEVEDARNRIVKRMLDYEQVLRGGTALFDTLGRQATREEWRRYVSTLQIQTYFPGIQGIGFARMFPAAELGAHQAALRAEGMGDYAVRPAGARDTYSAIVYLEPLDWRNRRAIGYDMFSEPVRRAAMEQARDTGQPSVSGRVTLVQETDRDVQAGFLMYLPVYRPGMPADTSLHRRAALLGFVYSPFRMEDLMHGILGTDNPDLAFAVFDGTRARTADTLLYRSHAGEADGSFQAMSTIDLPGRRWTVQFHSRPSFDDAVSSNQPEMIAFGGVAVDGLLFAIMWSLAGQRRRVEHRAAEMTDELRDQNRRMELAQRSARIGTWDYDLRENRLVWDEHLFELYGVEPGGFTGDFAAWQRTVHPSDLSRVERELQKAIDGEAEFHTVFRIVLGDGSERVLEGHGIVLRDLSGRAYRVIGMNRDVSERVQAEQRLRLAASVFDHAHEGIAITDSRERIIEVNPTFCEITGFTREEIIGQTPRILKSGHQTEAFYAEMWQQIARDGYWRGEIWNRRKTGELYAELLTVSAVHGNDGQVTHYVGVFADITVVKEHQHRLERMAHFDALTQLPNRVLLADRLQQAMAQARRTGRLLAVCYLDLDGFKGVNDRFGHDVGDQLLVRVAERLNAHLRDSDSVARLGGDEFVLLLGNLASLAECEQALDRLLRALAESYDVGKGQPVAISASIGVTLYPKDEADADTLLRHADQAMYLAKQTGRDRYYLFDPEHDRQARAHREAQARIEAALAAREFVLYYQPKVDMRRGCVAGAEALVRWNHPERGLLPPAEFLPIIAESEFSADLGDWVLETALGQIEQWRRSGLDLAVSVNISGRHLQKPGFAARLKALLAQYPDVLPQRLELEVLETAALEDIALVSQVINECHSLGVSFALDDFGTGYSSLTYLRRLPANTLKIDQSFVRDMLSDPEDLAIIEGIVSLSHAFQRQVIAEGVETEEHGALLLRIGCDLAQGYGIARPMPADRIEEWTRNYRQSSAWAEAGEVAWHREDLPLIGAEVDHRRWVDDVIACVRSASHVPPPPLDEHQCRFGRWYDGTGYARYGTLPEFGAIAISHARIHALAREMLDLRRSGREQEARNRIDELIAMRVDILKHLHALKTAVL